MSVEQQVKAGLRALRDFLAGRSGDPKVADTEDKVTRDFVAAELLAKMSGSAISDAASAPTNTQETPHLEGESARNKTKQYEYSENAKEEEQERERARKLFLDHGYFDEAVQVLGTAISPDQRAAAARTLGLVGSQRGTAHLIAAMFDDDPEVRTKGIDEADPARSVLPQESNRDIRGPGEAAENAFVTPTTGQADYPVPQTVVSYGAPSKLIAIDPTAANSGPTVEEEQLLLEEHRIRESAEQLSRLVLVTAAARKQSEQEIQSRIEREASLRAEAVVRRSEEEELRKRADDEAARHNAEEREALTAEQVARARAETEAQRLAEEETRLRLEAVELRLAAAELASRRAASETARKEAAETAREAEAKRARDEAKMRHDGELARLRSEEEALRTTADQIVLRRAEVDAEREKADAEAQRLVEAHARMQAAAETGAQAEAERSRLEAEINQRTATALRLLEETRRRGQEEQERLQEETRYHAEEQHQRLAEMELLKTRAEVESRELTETEQQILSQVNSLRFADLQTRKRIEDAEARRHAAEAAYRLVAEKVQRVEAEAHARAKEEEQMLAKLEAERRTVAVEAQSREAQERRIREEIAMFHRLEEQERPRLEAATLERMEAEARLQYVRQHAKGEGEIPLSAEEKGSVPGHDRGIAAEHAAPTNSQEHLSEDRIQNASSAAVEVQKDFTEASAVGPGKVTTAAGDVGDGVDGIDHVDGMTASTATPSIFAYLNSVDPYKRAAAVAELARSRSQDAFSLILNCFDDSSPHVRNAAARAFRKLEPNRTVDLFNRAMEESPDERRRNIGAAIAASGLAAEAINHLVSENREETYNALSILFVMAKTGEVGPLVRALEEHPGDEIGKAVAKLLTLSGHSS